MPDYDLTRLGSRAFEQMVVALAHAEIGPGVQAFGDGRDGGREATCEVPIDWSKTVIGGSSSWNGRTVFQAKFRVKPQPEPMDNAVWLQGEIGKELQNWVKAKRNRTRSWFPDYIVFVTNVDLSPVAKSGGIDALDTYVQKRIGVDSEAAKAGLNIQGYRIWHADQIRSMLDGHQDIRWAYPGLLSVGDILSLLADKKGLRLGSLDIEDPLRDEMLRSLQSEQWVRLGQAGASGDEKLRLHDVLIDLPVGDEGGGADGRALREVFALGDRNLRRRQPDPEPRPGIVFVGGPGQGKSTLSQAISQGYRAALLKGADLAPSATEIVSSTEAALTSLAVDLPGNRRWPVRVDLAKYSEELIAGRDMSLLRWIATGMSRRIESDISPADLRSWLTTWPWALVLDGLDEVPSVDARRLLRAQIDDLLATAEDVDADLLIIVTTRPTGYDERFPAETYRHLSLLRLPAEDAGLFAERIVNTRFTSDPDMRDRVVSRMKEASSDSSTQRLMQTPLQVTIMSLIVEKFPNLPPDRFTLFDLYYNTIFDREIGKEIPVARFLAHNRQQIDRLHESVGLRLQVVAESAEGAEAVLPVEELRELVTRQLRSRGFDAEAAEATSTTLVDAAMTRLVLLVPRDDGVGFEVRTLQEMLAARCLTASTDERIVDRLAVIAHHPHWRNTWLLAAGRLLASSERFEQILIRLLRQLDTDPRRLSAQFPTAPSLAAQLLDDNLGYQRPRFEKALVQLVLSQLASPPMVDVIRPAHAFLVLLDGAHWEAVLVHIRSALSGDARARASALTLVDRLCSFKNVPHRGALNGLRDRAAVTPEERDAVTAWLMVVHTARRHTESSLSLRDYLLAQLKPISPSLVGDARFLEAISSFDGARLERRQPEDTLLTVGFEEGIDGSAFVVQLADEEIAISVEMALESVPPADWAAISMLGALALPSIQRRPVGADVWAQVRLAEEDESDYE